MRYKPLRTHGGGAGTARRLKNLLLERETQVGPARKTCPNPVSIPPGREAPCPSLCPSLFLPGAPARAGGVVQTQPPAAAGRAALRPLTPLRLSQGSDDCCPASGHAVQLRRASSGPGNRGQEAAPPFCSLDLTGESCPPAAFQGRTRAASAQPRAVRLFQQQRELLLETRALLAKSRAPAPG